ncbi:MAG: hypothetical protein EHM55_22725 [Acidobacteria bacterium]|nr:MAG: hypothetical protein EHM55_22725 [Acidobacteriota bacterium]
MLLSLGLADARNGDEWVHATRHLEASEPFANLVPTSTRLVHQTFIPGLDCPQVAEGRRSYAGSNKPSSVERDSVGKEQLLEPLALVK